MKGEGTIMLGRKINSLLILSILIFSNESWAGKKLLPTDGRRIVKNLKAALDKGTTTSCRKEQKSVIPQKIWEEIVAKLLEKRKSTFMKKNKVPPIELASRDKLPEGGTNGTYTFYGKGKKFMNQGIPTKIRMRARFYLNIFDKKNDGTEIVRSGATKDKAFLEIKIRNPSPKEINSVNKFRIMIKDEDLLRLFKANPKNEEEFSALIDDLIANSEKLPENKDQMKMVKTLFKTIFDMARRNPDFIKPVLGVSYERRGYSYTEKKYPLSRADRKAFGGSEVEYQITVDSNLRGYLPKLKDFKKGLNFEKYFQESSKDTFGHYALNATVIEFKDPQPMSNFPLKKMSPIHRFLYKELVHKMHDPENVIKGYTPNKGKASHFLQFLREHVNADPNADGPKKITGIEHGEFTRSAKLLLSLQGQDAYVFAKKVSDNKERQIDGKLELMGGRVDQDESALAALIREVGEEDSSGILAKVILSEEGGGKNLAKQTVVLPFEPQDIFAMEISPAVFDEMQAHVDGNKENTGYEIISKKDLKFELKNHPERFTKKTLKIFKKLKKL